MDLLVSFCNVTAPGRPALGLLNLATAAFRPLRLPDDLPHPLGITGLALTDEFLFAARQGLSPGDRGELLVFERSALRLVGRHAFQAGVDVHSLWVSGDQFYAVSTGTDEVLRLQRDGPKVRSEAVLWRPEPGLSRADHHHLNAVGEWRGDLLVSGFGPKVGQRWSQARQGFLFNISKGEKLTANIHHPHSLVALEDTLAYCESAPMTVATLAGTRSPPLGGYTRGLCAVGGQLYVGTSIGRLVSRSTGQVTNPAEAGLPVGRCAVLRLSADLEVEQTVDLSGFAAEIYDLLPVEGTARWPVARPKARAALPRTEQSTPAYALGGFTADSPTAAQPRPSAGELASIIILCCNELAYTRLCLESVLAHTRPPYELLLVDNGSSDGTPAYLEEIRQRPGPARVAVIRNANNLGFAAGCNQGLAAARGRYLVLLNNDTVVPAGWLEGLVAWALHDWPQVGLVGPVSNYAAPPQQVSVPYPDLAGAHAFAARRAREFFRKALRVERLTGFCLLVRREVLERIGALDERFGLGFFEDDDLCVRAREAGFRLLVALNVFVHHFGSRTFRGLGLDCQQRLAENFERFQAKWGPERSAGYRLAGRPSGGTQDPAGGPAAVLAPDATPCPPRTDRPAGTRPRVSLCMMVKNEEANLPDCLASVAGLFDEIVVVDTGSVDRTREVATHAGAKVVDFPWVDSFAAARNESLRHATGDWICWLDADDRLDDANRQKLQALFAELKEEHAAYVMKCLCLPDPQTGTSTVVDHVRLFRNDPRLRWKYRIHEQILPALRATGATVRWADVVIQHTGYQDAALRAKKRERDLRLLQLEDAEHPDDPFTLFNLGMVYQEQGRVAEAVTLFQRSLQRSQPTDSIVRKLFALLLQCHRQLGQHEEMLAACRAGRRLYPEDAELLFQEGLLLRERGDRAGAQARFQELLTAREGTHFASVAAGLRGYKARHNLAILCREQGQTAEAETHWQAAVAEEPGFIAGWAGLGELYLDQGRAAELEEVLIRLRGHPRGAVEATVLQARVLLARREFAAARELLEGAIREHPQALPLRVVFSHALLQEGQDWAAAERALRDVLALDPGQAEARRNLAVLLRQQG